MTSAATRQKSPSKTVGKCGVSFQLSDFAWRSDWQAGCLPHLKIAQLGKLKKPNAPSFYYLAHRRSVPELVKSCRNEYPNGIEHEYRDAEHLSAREKVTIP